MDYLNLQRFGLFITQKKRCFKLKLSPVEQEKLLLHVAGELAIKRKERGVKLNYPESMALLAITLWKVRVTAKRLRS